MRTAALYVGLFGILLIVLSLRVSFVRRDARVALGDGDNEMLRRRIRAHGNFVEFVPIALLLLALAEHTGLGSLFIHLFGIVLLAGAHLARLRHLPGQGGFHLPHGRHAGDAHRHRHSVAVLHLGGADRPDRALSRSAPRRAPNKQEDRQCPIRRSARN